MRSLAVLVHVNSTLRSGDPSVLKETFSNHLSTSSNGEAELVNMLFNLPVIPLFLTLNSLGNFDMFVDISIILNIIKHEFK